MPTPHIDLSVVIGIAGGIIGAAGVFRTAKINGLKADVDSLCRQVAELTTRCGALDVRCQSLKDNLDRAEAKVVEHYTARIRVADENRELNQLVRERDETIITVQREIIEIQKNTLAKVAAR